METKFAVEDTNATAEETKATTGEVKDPSFTIALNQIQEQLDGKIRELHSDLQDNRLLTNRVSKGYNSVTKLLNQLPDALNYLHAEVHYLKTLNRIYFVALVAMLIAFIVRF